RVDAGLINNQAAAAARDFAERAVAAANTRFPVPETFGNRKPEAFHQRRINGERAFAIKRVQGLIVDVFEPGERSAFGAQGADFAEYGPVASPRANQFQFESETVRPHILGRV